MASLSTLDPGFNISNLSILVKLYMNITQPHELLCCWHKILSSGNFQAPNLNYRKRYYTQQFYDFLQRDLGNFISLDLASCTAC